VKTLPFELTEADLLCVVGPTASQKTELAIRVCEELGGEVVSADSVQIYKHFDLGSGRPTPAEQARAKHHLIDELDPLEPIDASRFALLADGWIEQIRSRGLTPVVCGGTFMWVRALVFGLAAAPPGDPVIRKKLEDQAQEHGIPWLHEQLEKVDPVIAARLGAHDFVRIQRALEVFQLSGRPLSEWHAQHQQMAPRHKVRFVGIHWEKNLLEERIRNRAKAWLEQGWIEEVRALIKLGYGETRAINSVGYRQVLEHIHGKISRHALLDEVVRATKIFARRQRTWLREQPVSWLKPLE
jgi:tRNA dimethylallyltransferase